MIAFVALISMVVPRSLAFSGSISAARPIPGLPVAGCSTIATAPLVQDRPV